MIPTWLCAPGVCSNCDVLREWYRRYYGPPPPACRLCVEGVVDHNHRAEETVR